MALINTILPHEAEGDIQQGYALFQEKGVEVPAPLQLLSASPGLFKIMMQRSNYYMTHPNLSFALLAHIRYLVAAKVGYKACKLFNKKLLLMQGSSEAVIETMESDLDATLLEEREKELLAFVLKGIDNPESVVQADIDTLREAGWTDNDIFDALSQGVSMLDHHRLMRAFKMEPC